MNEELFSEIIYSCLLLISKKRFEPKKISSVEIDQIIQDTIDEHNLDISCDDTYEIYLSVLNELQEFIH